MATANAAKKGIVCFSIEDASCLRKMGPPSRLGNLDRLLLQSRTGDNRCDNPTGCTSIDQIDFF